MTLIYSALAGPGSSIALLHGISLTLCLAASSFVCVKERTDVLSFRVICLAFVLPGLVGAWSVGASLVVIRQANEIAARRPFCVAMHNTEFSQIPSMAKLRGLYLHIDRLGFKDSSTWYFHGVLLVQAEQELQVYNWSPRNMSFHRLAVPEDFFVSPTHSCKPQNDFWSTVPLI